MCAANQNSLFKLAYMHLDFKLVYLLYYIDSPIID